MMHSRMRQTQLKREQYSRVRRNLLLGDFWQRYQEQVDCEQKRLQLPEMTTQEERDFNYDKNKESRQKTSYTSRQAAGRVVVRLIKQVWASSSEDNPALWNQRKIPGVEPVEGGQAHRCSGEESRSASSSVDSSFRHTA